MHTYKMTISYDGTRYRGWQKQQNTDQTIQGILERMLSEICGTKVSVHGSGRTDCGVHAFGQEASFKVKLSWDVKDLQNKLNEVLPEDIRILRVEEREAGFHARKSAIGKCYEYYVDTHEKADVFSRKYCFHFPKRVDIDRMKVASEYVKGIHDFSAFTDSKEKDDTVREIFDIQIQEVEGRIVLTFYGEGFLYHMVRILTGTLLEVGTGNLEPERMKEILFSKDRRKAGFPAPAKGLFLKNVYYE